MIKYKIFDENNDDYAIWWKNFERYNFDDIYSGWNPHEQPWEDYCNFILEKEGIQLAYVDGEDYLVSNNEENLLAFVLKWS